MPRIAYLKEIRQSALLEQDLVQVRLERGLPVLGLEWGCRNRPALVARFNLELFHHVKERLETPGRVSMLIQWVCYMVA